MSIRLRCTVRGCAGILAQQGGRLACARGHAFDRAREGYWNLLQPQDRRSAAPGDRAEATRARRSWLARGFVDGLVAMLAGLVREVDGRAIDVGCGEGTLTARLLGGRAAAAGVDLSAPAIALAARLAPHITWIVANADRALPFVDRQASLALSIFGRRPAAELARVLDPGGTLICVLPGADDLIELRAAAAGQGRPRDRAEGAWAELDPYFVLRERRSWRSIVHHDREALREALAMSYRGARSREAARLASVEALDVTLDAEILVGAARRVR